MSFKIFQNVFIVLNIYDGTEKISYYCFFRLDIENNYVENSCESILYE